MRFNVSDRQMEVLFGGGLLVSVLLLAIVGEVGLRAFYAATQTKFDWDGFRAATWDHSVETRLKPFLPNAEFAGIRFNSHGFRGPDIAREKPADAIRIAFLGDSKLLSVSLGSDEMLAPQVSERLSKELPACRFEHVTAAGPDYTTAFLSDLTESRVKPLKPDLYVLLVGSLFDVIGEHDKSQVASQKIMRPESFLMRHSVLFERLMSSFARVQKDREDRRQHETRDLVAMGFVQTLDRMFARLDDVTDGAAVVAVGYRGQMSDASSPDETARLVDRLRLATRGLSVDDIVALRALVLDRTEQTARSNGWFFSDPIAKVASDGAYFSDPSHLTAEGIEIVADHLVPDIAGALRSGGHACASGR